MNRLKEEKSFCAPPLGRWMVLAVCLLCLWTDRASALGTPAGTTIANTAVVSYTLASDPTPLAASASNTFDVQEIIDVTLTWQDAANVPVDSPQTGSVLSFLLTNTGNGPEDFQLAADATLGGDQFDPAVQSLWIESNGTAGLQADDTPYPAGGVTLNADENAVIYVASDIAPDLNDGDTGVVELTAAAMTSGAAGQPAGTQLAGVGFNGVDVVVGGTQADSTANGTYQVSAVTVALTKSVVQIVDPLGGDRPHPGARVLYRIEVSLTGSGSAEALAITDPIPNDMTYVAGSLVLDANPLTDGLDADAGDVGISAADTVTVRLGDTAAPATHIIEFSTTIN